MNRNVRKLKKNDSASKKTRKRRETSSITFVKAAETRKLKLYKVVWRDHAVSGTKQSWYDINDIKCKALTCYSVGYLVDSNKEAIALAQNVGENGTVGEITTILKSCIIKQVEL